MDIQNLKNHILDNALIPDILENLGCHSVSHKSGYYRCGNPDGDNKTAITVYENENLTTVDYTRDIVKDKRSTDIIDLVQFFLNCNFFTAVKQICDWIELDYYNDFDEDLPESLRFTKMMAELSENKQDEDSSPLKPISEKILGYYLPYGNPYFYKDNISYSTQSEFEVGYDESTNRITIPIRDELGTFVGVKARLFSEKFSENEPKYNYIERCNKSKILYGLYKTAPFIARKGSVFVTESEKGVMQLWDMGYQNAVATCGKNVSRYQIEKLTRLCVDVIFLFDKDVDNDEIKALSEKFIDCVKVYAVIDRNGVLSEKESPTDNPEKFKFLIENSCERIN